MAQVAMGELILTQPDTNRNAGDEHYWYIAKTTGLSTGPFTVKAAGCRTDDRSCNTAVRHDKLVNPCCFCRSRQKPCLMTGTPAVHLPAGHLPYTDQDQRRRGTSVRSGHSGQNSPEPLLFAHG